MDLDDLHRISNEARESAFRLETLPQYLVPSEAERLALWNAGEPLPSRTPENSEWLARLQHDIAKGFRWYRVHILDQPLTAYLRFELYSYLESVTTGSEIYVVDRDDRPELADLHKGFWIFDDEIAVRTNYDDEGRFLHPELIEDIEPYREMLETALWHSEPLAGCLARKNFTPETLRMTG